jgi:ketosteroid isomerase-like protein
LSHSAVFWKDTPPDPAPGSRDTDRAMSQENVEVVRRVFEQFQAGMERGDPGAGLSAPDIEWVTPQFEGRRVWRGREGFVEFVRAWTEGFEDWSLQVERLIDAGGDRVVVLTHQSATGKASGVPVELDSGVIYEVQDGRIIRGSLYGSHGEALEAAGLRE